MTAARLRAGLPLVLLLGAVVVAALLVGPGRDGPPLDPRSTGPDGTKALVDVAGALGADVEVVAAPRDGDDVALLLTDPLPDERRAAVEAWVRGGGTLVVGDPASPFTPEVAGTAAVAGFVQAPLERDCDVPALAAVAEVAPAPSSALYAAPPAAQACFARDGDAWLVVEPLGEGLVVALGGPDVLVNAELGAHDHGLLAASLLAPEPGTRVAFLRPPRPGEGDAGLGDLVDPRVRAGLWQLLVAFLLVAAWRARGLGRPPEESHPVRIPGSELVVAVGNLLHQTRATRRAALLLRAEAHRLATERLGLAPGTSAEHVAEAVARRTGLDRAAADRVLVGPLPVDEAGLVALGQAAERLRSALTTTRAGTDQRRTGSDRGN